MKATKQSGKQPVMEWIYAGPYEQDVSDLYGSNYSVPLEPYLPLVEEARSKLRHFRPAEGQAMDLFGQHASWTYKRTDPSESKITWARYGMFARFLATYAYTQIAVGRAGTHRFTLWVAGSAVVLINGKEVFSHARAGRTEGEFRFEAELAEGTNDCMILLYNVHLHCANSFTLMLEENGFEVQPPLLLADSSRRQLEDDFAKFYLERHILEGHDRLKVNLEQPAASRGKWAFAIFASYRGEKLGDIFAGYRGEKVNGEPDWQKTVDISAETTEIDLCACDELAGWRNTGNFFYWKGEFLICIDYISETGQRVEGVRLAFHRLKFMECGVGGDNAGRRQLLMNYYAASPDIIHDKRDGAFQQLTRLMAGRTDLLDIAAIEGVIEYINRRYDCSDFALHGLLRMYCRYRHSDVLPDHLKEAMKQCILGFKYWEDEPGNSMMFTRSENHEILFFSAEYVAGLLFPTEIFPNSGQNGLFHIQKGKSMAERWMKEKGKYGFMEWHSNEYYEEDLLALLSLYDFGEENSCTRILAKNLIDFICFLMATHSYRGVMGTTHGRSYEDAIIHPELENMSHILWLLFGQPGRIRGDKISRGAVALMDSGYVPHEAFGHIANSAEPLYTLSRMGLFPHEGLGGVNCATYRTADYMVSGMVESMKGRHGHQTHAGQALLAGNLPVFVTCFDNKSETARPSYWGGQYRIPKTIAHKNVLAYIYNISENVGNTHCYFPIPEFDETCEAGKWVFGRKYNAYVAVYSLKPYKKTASGKYRNRELMCFDKRNIWLIETGSKRESGSFADFVRAVSGAALTECGEDIVYDSPSVGQMRLGWDAACTIAGKPAVDGGFPLIGNSFADSGYGSGITCFQLGGQSKVLNFNI